MKSIYLILSFLLVFLFGWTEACDSSGKKPKKSYAVFKCDLLIIGGGPQAAALLAQLLLLDVRPLGIIIIEANSTFGTGLPFDKKNARPEHLLNAYSAASVAISGDPSEFLEWLQKKKFILYLATLAEQQMDTPSRITIGEYLTFRFHDYQTKLGEKGFRFSLMHENTAEDISLHRSGLIAVKLSSGATVLATDVFLATGHWYRRRFDKPPKTYFESPWPASKLKKGIRPSRLIGIFGSSLTAVDAVLTLAHKFGKFHKMQLPQAYYKASKEFLITMYSRSGKLPRIAARREITTRYTPKHMTNESITQLVNGQNSIAFNAILRELKQDLIDLVMDDVAYTKIDELTNKEFFALLDKALLNVKSPEQSLIDNINNQEDDVETKLDTLYRKSDKLFDEYRSYITGEEGVIFREHLASRIGKTFSGIPMENAQKLQLLIKNGHLKLVAVGSGCKVTLNDRQRVTVEYENKKPIDHDYFVDATGQSGHIAKDPRPLTESLLRNGLAEPFLIEYSDQTAAHNAYKDDNAVVREGIDKKRTVRVGSRYYYESDGVKMDSAHMRVLPRSDNSPQGNIYASMPFTFSYYAGVQALPVTVTMAKRAVGHLKKEWETRDAPGRMPPVLENVRRGET